MLALHHPDRYPGATVERRSMPRALQLGEYVRSMSDTRYGHSNVSGGNQDQGERKDDGWESRQGGRQSRNPGTKGGPTPSETPGEQQTSQPPPGTNTQGELAGIGEASDATRKELDPKWQRGTGDAAEREDDARAGE
jgi:hypothetical protein